MTTRALLAAALAGLLSSSCATAEYARHPDERYPADYDDDGGYGGGALAGRALTAAEPPGAPSLFDAVFGGEEKAGMLAAAPPPAPPQAEPVARPAPAEPDVTDVTDVARPPPSERLVIYTAGFTVVVAGVEPAIEKLLARTDELGGYLASRSDTTVTVRVPAAKFFVLLDEVEGYGVVSARNVNASDVTMQYRDVELRLEVATRSRARLLELLAKAEKMEDILRIEAEVRRLTEEIEGMKGQLRYLADQIAMSTVTVTCLENAPPPVPVPDRRWSRFLWINLVGVENVLRDF